MTHMRLFTLNEMKQKVSRDWDAAGRERKPGDLDVFGGHRTCYRHGLEVVLYDENWQAYHSRECADEEEKYNSASITKLTMENYPTAIAYRKEWFEKIKEAVQILQMVIHWENQFVMEGETESKYEDYFEWPGTEVLVDVTYQNGNYRLMCLQITTGGEGGPAEVVTQFELDEEQGWSPQFITHTFDTMSRMMWNRDEEYSK